MIGVERQRRLANSAQLVEMSKARVRAAKIQVVLDWVLMALCLGIIAAAYYVDKVRSGTTWATLIAALIGVVMLWAIGFGVLPADRRKLRDAKDALWSIRWQAKR